MRGSFAYFRAYGAFWIGGGLLITLRENFRVTMAYTKPSIVTIARSSGPEPMEIDVIESSGDRRRAIPHKSEVCAGLQMVCFRCRKLGHRATDCRAPAPISFHVVRPNNGGAAPVARPKNDRNQKGQGFLLIVIEVRVP